MGKRKKQQQPVAEDFGSGLAAMMMAAAMQRGARRTISDSTARTYAEQNDALVKDAEDYPFMGAIRRIRASRALCDCEARDEVLVGATNGARWKKAQQVAENYGVEPVRSIVIYALNGHDGSLAPAELDVEDAKKLVNALSEAIAETELITAEAK